MASPGSRFSMGNVTAGAAKRGGETQAARVGPKVPKANEVTVIELPKQATTTAQRQPGFAPVTVCIYKVTDEAGDVWSVYGSQAGVQLWQVQICHNARPSITFGIVNSSGLRLKSALNEKGPWLKLESVHEKTLPQYDTSRTKARSCR